VFQGLGEGGKTVVEDTKKSIMKEKKQKGVNRLKDIREEWLEMKK